MSHFTIIDLRDRTEEVARATADLVTQEQNYVNAEERFRSAKDNADVARLRVKEAAIQEDACRRWLNENGPKHLRGSL